MKGSELIVTRLPTLRVSLLQIHGTTVQTAEQFATRVLGNQSDHRSPITGPRAYSIGPMEWLYILWKIPLYVRFLVARQTVWLRTRRDDER
jgi:hypothetical protein